MSKAVLISIRPKWCELIASGEKTIEIRKTAPKIKTPFKCYIYCTQASPYNPSLVYRYETAGGNVYIGGKRFKEFVSARVIGEFVCDEVIIDERGENALLFEQEGCVPFAEQKKYAPKKTLYGWHISNLVIYNMPKQLREFKASRTKHVTEKAFFQEGVCDEIRHVRVLEPLNRPPQSWCYVEEV